MEREFEDVDSDGLSTISVGFEFGSAIGLGESMDDVVDSRESSHRSVTGRRWSFQRSQTSDHGSIGVSTFRQEICFLGCKVYRFAIHYRKSSKLMHKGVVNNVA